MQPAGFQRATFAGIVATVLFLPLGALAALLSYLLFDISLRSFITFGDRLSEPAGVLVWWALAWLPAAAYVAIVSGRGLESRETRRKEP